VRRAVAAFALPLAMWSAGSAAADAAQPPARQLALVRMVRHDCGACHGMRLTGGLGPALTPQALADKPLDSMVAAVVNGRPGTPMPPWRAMLDEAEARWIVEQLMRGFPELDRQVSAGVAR